MKFGRLSDWLEWQETLHPSRIELGLDRVRRVHQRLGLNSTPVVIAVAGTNGKGSCVALFDAILRAAGYRVGCYTSPHISRYNERICIDGEPVDDKRLMAAFQCVEDARQDTELTYFEFGTLAAFEIFCRASLDVAVLEVGLGGRLDAVNVVDADLALVTTIGLDHTQWLGDDLESIGREKAGIFRRGVSAVYGAEDPPRSLLDAAEALDVPLWIPGRDYRYEVSVSGWQWHSHEGKRLGLPMPSLRGGHQLQNAAAVLAGLQRLGKSLPVDQRAIRSGLLSVRLPGRFDVRPGSPTLVLDVAHNPQAVCALAANLQRVERRGRLFAVFGALDDKDIQGMVAPLAASIDRWYLGRVEGQRGLDAWTLADRAGKNLDTARKCDTIDDAFDAALEDADPDDLVVVFGSFLVVAAISAKIENGWAKAP